MTGFVVQGHIWFFFDIAVKNRLSIFIMKYLVFRE